MVLFSFRVMFFLLLVVVSVPQTLDPAYRFVTCFGIGSFSPRYRRVFVFLTLLVLGRLTLRLGVTVRGLGG